MDAPEPITISSAGTKRKRLHNTETHQCLGICLSGLRCTYRLADPTLEYCVSHSAFEGKELVTRQCSGTFRGSGHCTTEVTVVKESGHPKPVLCNTHRFQEYCDFMRCYGKNDDESRCLTFIRMDRSPYFCIRHKDQAVDQVEAIRTISDDVMFLIMPYLQPHERVAFALVNKGCSNIVKSWGFRDKPQKTADQLRILHLAHRKGDERQCVLVTDRAYSNIRVEPDIFLQDTMSLSQNTVVVLRSEHGEKLTSVLACRRCRSGEHRSFRLRAPLQALHVRRKSILVSAMIKHPHLFQKSKLRCILCKRAGLNLHKASTCSRCQKHKAIWVQRCLQCDGLPSPLQISRLWWKWQTTVDATQGGDAEVTAGVN